MARPRKRAEWYQHSTDMKNNPCVRALRRRFGNNGYAVLNYLMEDIARTDELVLDFTPKKRLLYSAEYDVTQKELEEIVDFCVELDLCKYSDDDKTKLSSPYLEEELLKLLLERREKDRLRKLENNKRGYSTENNGYSTENNGYSTENNGYSTEKSTQSKVKESKVKHSSSADIRARENTPGGWSGDDLKVYGSVDGEIDQLRASPFWKEQVFMRFRFLDKSDQKLDEYLHRFSLEVKASGKSHQHLGDAKKHFMNWMIIQEDKLNKESKGYGNNQKRPIGERIREDLLEAAEDIRELNEERERNLRDGVSEEIWNI